MECEEWEGNMNGYVGEVEGQIAEKMRGEGQINVKVKGRLN